MAGANRRWHMKRSRVGPRVAVLATLALVAAGTLGPLGPAHAGEPVGTVTVFRSLGVNSPHQIAAGPDGNLWFTDRGNDTIGRITPTGLCLDLTTVA